MWESVRDWAIRELREVKRAPVAIGIAAAIGAAVAWVAIDRLYSERFEVMEQRITQLQEKPAPAPLNPSPLLTAEPRNVTPLLPVQRSRTEPLPDRERESNQQAVALAALPSQQTSAPNGIAIGGGVVTNPTVNNIVPNPQREISAAQALQLVELIKPFSHVKVSITLAQANNESTRFGMRLAEVLKSAGINVVEIQPAMTFGPPGQIPQMAFVVDRKTKGQEQLAYALVNALVSMKILKPPLGMNSPDESGNPEFLIIQVYPLG